MHHKLDDPGIIASLDPSGMFRLTDDFPDQCARAIDLARAAELPALSQRPNLVLLTGLGGSAAGGDFARALFEAQSATAFFVNRDDHIPHFVGLGDVVFCSSYSGNTEETLSAYAEAKKTGAKIVAVTSGGKLEELALADGHAVIKVPGGQPPRTAMGYMLMPVLVACERLGLLPEQDFDSMLSRLRSGSQSWGQQAQLANNPAKELAVALEGKIPVLYGLGPQMAVVANRWKCQINENAKLHAFANGFPELNHNEILGWVGIQQDGLDLFDVIVLEDAEPSLKMRARASITERLVASGAAFHHVSAKGASLLERMLGLAFMGDYVSLYMSVQRGVDPENIDWLITLKNELAAVRE